MSQDLPAGWIVGDLDMVGGVGEAVFSIVSDPDDKLQICRSSLALQDSIPFGEYLTIVNPGAESGVTGWTNTTGTLVSQNGGGSTGVPYAGLYNFAAGTTASLASYQDISVPSGWNTQIDAGEVTAVMTWQQGGWSSDADAGTIDLSFYDGSNTLISTTDSGNKDIGEGWVAETNEAAVPATTRKIRIIMKATRASGSNCDVYFDELKLKIKGLTQTYDCTIRATDENGQTFDQDLTLTITE